MKIVVASANFGRIDNARKHVKQTIDCDFIVFDESNFATHVNMNERTAGKYVKTQTHKLLNERYDVIIWVDGSIEITRNNFVETLINELRNNDIVVMNHEQRSCIYTHAQHMIDAIDDEQNELHEYFSKRYTREQIENEQKFFKTIGYEQNRGLYFGGIFARRNNDAINRVFDEWWSMICERDFYNDQIAFTYLMNTSNEIYVAKNNTIMKKYVQLCEHALLK